MKIKSVITSALLLFVGISVLTIFIKENKAERREGNTALKAQEENIQPASQTVSNTKTMVYYFHNIMRCKTCNTIEALTIKAIETGFSEELKNGTVELRILNVEDPGNEHFVQDYQLTSSTVVVSLLKNGTDINWKRLDRVWQLVRDESAFINYIQEETSLFVWEEIDE